jgi:hypothetical protein
MADLVVAVDRAVGVAPAELAAAWDKDDEAHAAGLALVHEPEPGEFLGDVLALVVIPLAVNLASSAACAVVSRLVTRLREAPADEPSGAAGEVEVVAEANEAGDLVVVVRLARPPR